jgi:hypothetical protein
MAGRPPEFGEQADGVLSEFGFGGDAIIALQQGKSCDAAAKPNYDPAKSTCFQNSFPQGLALRFAQTDSGSPAILSNELNSGLFEGAPHIFKRTRIWLPCSAFKVRNGLRGCFACL